jgi:hypothetical protein
LLGNRPDDGVDPGGRNTSTWPRSTPRSNTGMVVVAPASEAVLLGGGGGRGAGEGGEDSGRESAASPMVWLWLWGWGRSIWGLRIGDWYGTYVCAELACNIRTRLSRGLRQRGRDLFLTESESRRRRAAVVPSSPTAAFDAPPQGLHPRRRTCTARFQRHPAGCASRSCLIDTRRCSSLRRQRPRPWRCSSLRPTGAPGESSRMVILGTIFFTSRLEHLRREKPDCKKKICF